MHRIDLRRTKYLRFVNRLIELQFLSFIACKTKCEHNSNTCLFNGTSNVSKILTDNVRESKCEHPDYEKQRERTCARTTDDVT